jgi:hypothetical protein
VCELSLGLEICEDKGNEREQASFTPAGRPPVNRVLTFEGIGHETLYASCERACDQGEVRRLVLREMRPVISRPGAGVAAWRGNAVPFCLLWTCLLYLLTRTLEPAEELRAVRTQPLRSLALDDLSLGRLA